MDGVLPLAFKKFFFFLIQNKPLKVILPPENLLVSDDAEGSLPLKSLLRFEMLSGFLGGRPFKFL